VSPQPSVPSVAQNQSQQTRTGTVSGTVLDPNGNAIEGATVTLSKAGTRTSLRDAISNPTGGFEFSGVGPGTYVITISGAGMSPFVSKPVSVQVDQPVVMPKIILSVAATTSSITVLDPVTASIEQEHIAEQQRVFGVFNNFYSSFDWNAPPMMTKQKYGLAVHTLIDPISFLITGGIAGAEQYRNVFPSFGSGWQGYAKRYGAAYAGHASGELFTRAIYPSIFHQDPRYFVMQNGSTKQRAAHAVISTFVTRDDRGEHRFNYSEILGDLSAGAAAEAYYPSSERGPGVFLINGLGDIAGDAIDNLFREFLFNKVTRRAKRPTKP